MTCKQALRFYARSKKRKANRSLIGGSSDYSVYCLCDGRSVRYFGITRGAVSQRFSNHRSAAAKTDSPLGQWLRSCGNPRCVTLRSGITQRRAVKLERDLIRFFKTAFRLVNTSKGGSTGNLGRESRYDRMLLRLARARAAKEAKRLANPVEREPKLAPYYPLQLGVRDKRTGDTAWVDFRSLRDAMRRLAVVQRYYR